MYENKEHIIYSAADIRRYLNGEMNREEMYALEKQAAEDPFLADAIDGYTGITIEAAEADLGVLRARLNQVDDKQAKVVAMKPRGFKWWKQGIAAAIAGLVIVTAAMLLKNDKKNKEIAANTTTEKTTATPNTAPTATGSTEQPGEPVTNSPNPEKTGAKSVFVSPDSINYYLQQKNNTDYYNNPEAKPINEAAGEYKNLEQVKSIPVVADSAEKRKSNDLLKKADADVVAKEVLTAPGRSSAPSSPPVIAAEPRQVTENVAAGNNRAENVAVNDRRRSLENKYEERGVTQMAKKQAPAQRDDETMNDKFVNNFSRNFMFNYRVTDNNGNSIPFSNISIPSDQLTTYSRSDGSFGLFSADSVLRVNVKAAGYEPKSFLLRNNTAVSTIMLNEESLAKDKNMVIVGDQKNFVMRKQNKLKSAAEKEEAEPLDGWSSYDSYLANNIDLTDKHKGEVELSIEVDKKGQVKNVTIEKSLGAKEDQEAIRLVTQGPKWKGKKKKSKGRVVVTF